MNALYSPWVWSVLLLVLLLPPLFVAGTRLLVQRVAASQSTHGLAGDVGWLFDPRAIAWGRYLRWGAVAALIGTGVGIIAVRFVYGIGAVTNLSDAFPWGIWIGFDVMGGVALAAGAFVIAATAHVFGVHRFEPLVRPALLTGLLGYLMVIFGLLVDLGRPYNVWRPLVHWQIHSPLWEVGCCVAIYTTVLLIEFLPVALERINRFQAIASRLPTVPLYQFLRRFSIVFVGMGVVLSTLHQSSLGSLWVLMPVKLSPLWYSIWLPALFWISAVAVGLAMTIVEATLSAKAFGRGLEIDLLKDLAKAAAVVLAIYLAAKVADLISRDAWPLLFQPTLQAAALWVEVGLGVIVPMILFAVPRLRRQPNVLFGGSLLVVFFGVVLNRLNISWIGLLPYTGPIYVPSWMEVTVSLTLVTIGVLAFGLAARYLPVFEEEEKHEA